MRKDVYDYFVNLRKQGFDIKDNHIIADNRIKFGPKDKIHDNVQICKFDGKRYYVKETKYNQDQTLASIVSAEMYNDLGILTPPVELIQREILLPNGEKKIDTRTIQQDVMSVSELISVLAIGDGNYMHYTSDYFESFKWAVLYESSMRNRFLQFVTPECLDKLISVFLVDDLRSDNDRKTDNYFLVKTPGSELWEDIVPIDLENMIVYNHHAMTKSDFEAFKFAPYTSATPHGKLVRNWSYQGEINEIKELLEDGVLSENNISALKNALNYDLPGAIKQKGRAYKMSKTQINSAHTQRGRLWNFHQKEFEHLLDL